MNTERRSSYSIPRPYVGRYWWFHNRDLCMPLEDDTIYQQDTHLMLMVAKWICPEDLRFDIIQIGYLLIILSTRAFSGVRACLGGYRGQRAYLLLAPFYEKSCCFLNKITTKCNASMKHYGIYHE